VVYQDRRAAGKTLAEAVKRSIRAQPELAPAVVLGLPRGGVPVAFEVAMASSLPLDVLVVRKLGAPGEPELAMGAITSDGTVVLNDDIVRELRIREETLKTAMRREQEQAQMQERTYRQGSPPLVLDGLTVILVDDGLATGATMRAAVRAVRLRARRVIVAVPVGAAHACEELAEEADLVICPYVPLSFGAVGQFYQSFGPTSEQEVCMLLAETQPAQPGATRPPDR
jgi:predicted phosphoribosyltransferase